MSLILNPPSNEWKIGLIVASKAHPFFADDDMDAILIGGDNQLLSPLMVVVETLKENNSLYDEISGDLKVQKGTFQCRCIWFSQKSYKIEDAWFSSRSLKIIHKEKPESFNFSIDSAIKTYGSLVTLKTAQLEIKKRKSSLKTSSSRYDGNKSISALHSFVCPVLQVIGDVKSESKEPLFDAKTGESKRIISKRLIKCRYYNSLTDKLSEELIPIEALEPIIELQTDAIQKIKNSIAGKTYLKVKSLEGESIEELVQPQRITYLNGYYFLEAWNFRLNHTSELSLNDIAFTEVDHYFKEKLPNFAIKDGETRIIRIFENTIKELDYSRYWRILYKNQKEEYSERTLSDCSIIHINEINYKGEDVTVPYLKAHCHSRNAERFFLIDRIQKIEVLNLDIRK